MLKNIRNLLFIFVSMSIIIAGIESPLAASAKETKSVRDSSFKSFIKQIKQNYGKQYSSHVEELFEVLLREERFDPSEAGPRFLEFDVLKMRDAIYIFKIETTCKIFPLFPRKKFSQQTNSLTPNPTYFVPPMKKWLPFDKGCGKEAIILSAFMKGSYDIETLMKYFNTFNTENRPTNTEKAKPVKEIPIISKGISGSKKSEE
ncbi:MAG: hypothetical protein ACUZ8H_05080 [Candidatus Anammoxibacter sp.]